MRFQIGRFAQIAAKDDLSDRIFDHPEGDHCGFKTKELADLA